MNDQQRAAMQMALETIEMVLSIYQFRGREWQKTAYKTKTALREALAQPQGEPVASNVLSDDLRNLAERFSEGWHEGMEIDASDIMLLLNAAIAVEDVAPPVVPQGEWVDLTDDEVVALEREVGCFAIGQLEAAIAKFKSKNTPSSVEAAIEATKEKAAKVCKELLTPKSTVLEWDIVDNCAAAIRSMK